MGRTARVLGGLLIWAASIVVVSSVAWYAIDSAGRQVTLTQADDRVPSTLASPAGRPSTSDPVPTASPSPSSSPDPSSSSPAPSRSSTPSGHRPAGTGQPGWTPPPTPDGAPPGPQPVTATVPTRGGSVELECTATAATDFSAQPADGWSGQVGRVSPSSIRAQFRQGTDVIAVSGSCSGGQPVFSVADHWDN